MTFLSKRADEIRLESPRGAYNSTAASDAILNDISGHICRMTNFIADVAKTMAELKVLLVRLVRADALRRYRPERHYMRGPGPQWHAKNHSLPLAH